MKNGMDYSLKLFNECKNHGVKMLFRDSFAQHFRFSYGGEYNGMTFRKNNLPELIGKNYSVPHNSFCSPIVYNNKYKVNWRYQLFNERFSVVNLNDQNICRSNDTNLIDYIPAYALSSYFWDHHPTQDCTHYLYTPSIYLGLQDGFHRVLLRGTLLPGKCMKIPDNSLTKYVQGPKGLKLGIEQNHHKEFLPQITSIVTLPNLESINSILKPNLN